VCGRWWAAVALLAAVAAAPPARSSDRRTVQDDAGRRVQVPARIERVFPAGGPATIILYTLAPEALVGWTRAPGPEERAFLPERYARPPTLGRLAGRGDTASVESVLARRPDVIVDYGAVTATYASLADRVQAQTGIPYLLYDGRLSSIPRAYRALGALLGVPARADELARHADEVLARVDERVARVPAAARPRVYYARGPRGLETGAGGAINVESLERMGVRNVAAEAGPARLARVSIEQVLAWDPDVVVTIDRDFARQAPDDAAWRALRAVREGHVHLAPDLPFPWIDFPPSVNRLVGLPWLGHVLYPSLFAENLREEARVFYARFYHRAPDETQLDALLGPAGRGRR
jgi:iron complex transport system substrate-binding protein